MSILIGTPGTAATAEQLAQIRDDIGADGRTTFETVAGTTYTVVGADFAGKTKRFTNASGCLVTVPQGLSQAAGKVMQWQRAAGAGQVTFQGDGTSTISSSDGSLTGFGANTVGMVQAQGGNAFLLARLTGAVLTGALGSSTTQAPTHSAVAAAIAALSGGGSGQVRVFKPTTTRPMTAGAGVNYYASKITVAGGALGPNGKALAFYTTSKPGTTDGVAFGIKAGAVGAAFGGLSFIQTANHTAAQQGAFGWAELHGNGVDETDLRATNGTNSFDPSSGAIATANHLTIAVPTSSDWEVQIGGNCGTVDTVTVENFIVIVFNPDAPTGGASTLASLTDVDLTGVTAGQSFVWNGTDMVPWGAAVADATTRAAVAADFQRPYLNWPGAATITLGNIAGLVPGDAMHLRHGGAQPAITAGANVTIANTIPTLALRGRTTLQLVGDDGTTKTFEYV